DGILHNEKCVIDEVEGFVTGFAARILQAIIKVGIFEVSQFQAQRLANHFTANPIGKLELDQLLDEPATLAKQGAEHKKTQFQNQIKENSLDALRICAVLDARHHTVNDQFSHPGLRSGQECSGEGQKSQPYGGPGICAPDEPHCL